MGVVGWVLFVVALIGAGVLFLLFFLTKRKLAEKEQEADSLKKYVVVKDAEAEADRIVQKVKAWAEDTTNAARQHHQQTVSEAAQVAEQLKAEANETLAQAREKGREASAKAESTLESANATAREIIERANTQAMEIAGEAMEAKGKAGEFEKIARAMENAVKGYGDEYLVPNRTAIDDLAEEFSYKDAGVRLKTARDRVKQMVKAGQASESDYAERNRRETALRFVLDAFNGKVDTALGKAKTDNFGTLQQEIRDAYELVNHNGRAFRNSRIQEMFLEARLDELKWLVSVNELKAQEREEQRRIKEEIREEEKARKDYERAIKQAEKEERTLQKALSEARAQLEAASDAERQKFEAKLAELQTKLEEAEAKNQRALSMAQQTRQGYVYVISNVGSFGEDVFKIGLTRRLEPMDRVKELGDASVPFSFDVHAMIHAEDAPALENELHRQFEAQQVNKVNPRKEFFRVGISDIRTVVQQMGIEAKWTMKAEAREFRESLAMLRAEGRVAAVAR